MKRIALCILAAMPVLTFAQGGKYVVEGSLSKCDAPAKVYLQYKTNNQMIIDSAVVIKGKFHFEGKLADDPLEASLILNPKGTGLVYGDNRQVYIDTGLTAVTGEEHLRDATIGGQLNADNEALIQAYKAMSGLEDQLSDWNNSVPPEQRNTDSFIKKRDSLVDLIVAGRNAVIKQFIQQHPDSYISLVNLKTVAYSADYAEIAPLFEGLSTRMKQTARGRHFAELLPRIKAVAIGATAPEFAEADTAGKTISLSSFRGKYVLVDFWASWCGPCRGENPNLVKAYKRYKNKNFAVLGVSLDPPDGRGRWMNAIHKDGLPWTQVSDLKFWDSEAAVLYGVKAIPQNFLIDPNGKIIAKNLRGYNLENELEEIFGKI